jgi:predicted lipoprotein
MEPKPFNRSHKITAILVLAAILASLTLSACSAFFTIVPISEEKQLNEGGSATNKGFDKVAYVDKIWDSQVLPTVKDKAIDFDTLYTSLKLSQEDASKKYGNKMGGPYNFITKFDGKITAVSTESRVGTMTVEAQAAGNPVELTVQIGPILRGTSIRDGVGFITFNEFVNQLQFADVADELNTRAYNMALKGKTFDASLVGKTVSVSGTFTLDSTLDKLVVTPVYLEIK